MKTYFIICDISLIISLKYDRKALSGKKIETVVVLAKNVHLLLYFSVVIQFFLTF